MGRVKCDDCGDEHSCEPATSNTVAMKPKQKLHPAMIAKNDKAKADKAKREGTTQTATTTAATTPAKRSVLRDLIGF